MAWLNLKVLKTEAKMLVNSNHIIRISPVDQQSSRIHLSEIDSKGAGETMIVQNKFDDLVKMLVPSVKKVVARAS